MPQGLAPVTARRARRLVRRAAKPLLCVVLALAALVSPWKPELLPDPLDGIAGQASVAAQPPPPPTVIDGTPNNCPTNPTLWSPQPSDSDFLTAPECILELPACPESPLVPGQYMRLSVPPAGLATEYPELAVLYADAIEYPLIPGMDRYPDFCEERVLQINDPATYNTCLNITGYTVIRYTDAGLDGCRLIYPIACAAGLHRSGSAKCRAVQRRTWTCATGYIPRNEFNTCYQAPTYSSAAHPACRQGAPEFLVMDCEDYAGNDFIHNPGGIDCTADYDTGTPAQHTDGTQAVSGAPLVELQQNYNSGLPSSDYWCAFDTRFLIPSCHRTDVTPAECSTASLALCLKRASATGGCNLTADTIRCRALEAAFAQQPARTTIEEVRTQGCAPCLILPFRSIPAQCQLTPSIPTVIHSFEKEKQILSVRGDFATDVTACRDVMTPADLAADAACRSHPVCIDPPRGRIDWTSNHFSRLAVINSPILVQFLDIPLRNRSVPFLYYSYGRAGLIGRSHDRAPHLTDASGDDPRLRSFSAVDQATQYSSVDQMVTAECRINSDPYLDVIVEELWPDSDRTTIEQLFGNDALAWWDSLSTAEQERRIQSRGLSLLSTPPTTAELEARSVQLTTQIHCDLAGGRACRWTPARPGFYRLTGVGAWAVNRSGRREWGTNYRADYLNGIIDHLLNVATPENGQCDPRPNWYNEPRNDARMRDKDCIRIDLRHTGVTAPSQVGLLDDLSGVLPHSLDTAVLFNEDHAATAACRTRDFRVVCSGGTGGYGTGNYTETEPIGIVVHEVRVSTVMPNN